MVKRTEPTAETRERELPVCPLCDRAFEERDVTWLHRKPKLVCRTDAKWLNRSHTSRASRENHASFEEAISVVSYWVVGVCDFCADDVYELETVSPRSLDAAREDANSVVTDGGVVNDYETTYRSTEDKVERTYCNSCEQDCTNEDNMLHTNPEMRVDRGHTGTFSRTYVSKNWYSDREPDWSDVVSLQSREEIHLCDNCFSRIRPSFWTRTKRLPSYYLGRQ